MKRLTLNEQEKEILIVALNNVIDSGILNESDNETALILMMALKR